MRFEIIVFLITCFFIANTYYDGKYVRILKQGKKYYQMAAIGFIGLSSCLFIKKKPTEAKSMISNINNIINTMPVDRNAMGILSPVLNSQDNNYSSRLLNSGNTVNKRTKRSVSETKKKYVASRQDWKCASCNNKLSAWFEVDHKQRLEYGGANHVDNLEALCRECHGKKTAMENMN